jgi:hypothetical protein
MTKPWLPVLAARRPPRSSRPCTSRGQRGSGCPGARCPRAADVHRVRQVVAGELDVVVSEMDEAHRAREAQALEAQVAEVAKRDGEDDRRLAGIGLHGHHRRVRRPAGPVDARVRVAAGAHEDRAARRRLGGGGDERAPRRGRRGRLRGGARVAARPAHAGGVDVGRGTGDGRRAREQRDGDEDREQGAHGSRGDRSRPRRTGARSSVLVLMPPARARPPAPRSPRSPRRSAATRRAAGRGPCPRS